jgi:hypothetical protein
MFAVVDLEVNGNDLAGGPMDEFAESSSINTGEKFSVWWEDCSMLWIPPIGTSSSSGISLGKSPTSDTYVVRVGEELCAVELLGPMISLSLLITCQQIKPMHATIPKRQKKG